MDPTNPNLRKRGRLDQTGEKKEGLFPFPLLLGLSRPLPTAPPCQAPGRTREAPRRRAATTAAPKLRLARCVAQMPGGCPWEQRSGIRVWLVDLKGEAFPKTREKRVPLGNWGYKTGCVLKGSCIQKRLIPCLRPQCGTKKLKQIGHGPWCGRLKLPQIYDL